VAVNTFGMLHIINRKQRWR